MPPKIMTKDATYVPPLLQIQTKNQASNKRIRVARACDNCRRRKVKCDGKQPCIHCTVYSYECTYNHFRAPTTNVKRLTKTSSEAVDKSKLGEKLISALFPEINLDDPTFNPDLFITLFEKYKHQGIIDLKSILMEYNSNSSTKITRSIDPVEIKIILPPRDIALKLVYRTWNDASVMFRFYHRTSFIKDLDSLYTTNPSEYSNHQNKILPLIYSVIAVGALFSKGDNAIDNQYLQDEGYKYFIAARKLIDITNSTDLESIQTIFMLTLFLQCSARLSTCYSYIGIALRSALRQGIHRKLETPCNFIKAECKKRLFWTVFKMEIYVNSMLGLPNSIEEDDINAELPQDIDDQYIEYEYIEQNRPKKLSTVGVNNSHTKLILVLNHIVKKFYKTSSPIHTTQLNDIKALENELKLWVYELPNELKPGVPCPHEYLKANKILNLDYLHVQIMLYRPFMHYVKIARTSPVPNDGQSFQFEYGLKCFEVAQKIIVLAENIIAQKLLNGSYWFSVYTIFFAVACLIYYFLEIDSGNPEIISSIERGKMILSSLKQRSVSAERIYNLLNHMFENYDRTSIKLEALDINKSHDSAEESSEARGQQRSYPLNNFSSPTNDSLVNMPATLTVDKVGVQEPTTLANMDSFDIKIFGNFLPSYMLSQSVPIDDLPLSQQVQANTVDGAVLESPLDSEFVNHAQFIGSTETSGSSVKTDDDENVAFDWERFFDKDDNLNFDI